MSHQRLMLYTLTCVSPGCAKAHQEIIGDLAGKDKVRCPHCGSVHELSASSKAVVKDMLDLATKLDLKYPERSIV